MTHVVDDVQRAPQRAGHLPEDFGCKGGGTQGKRHQIHFFFCLLLSFIRSIFYYINLYIYCILNKTL